MKKDECIPIKVSKELKSKLYKLYGRETASYIRRLIIKDFIKKIPEKKL